MFHMQLHQQLRTVFHNTIIQKIQRQYARNSCRVESRSRPCALNITIFPSLKNVTVSHSKSMPILFVLCVATAACISASVARAASARMERYVLICTARLAAIPAS